MAEVGVGFALSVAQTLFSALQSSPNLKEICSKFRYEAELEELKGTVSTIGSVLLDVDDKQLELSHQAKNWIDRLKDALYDADDALDEFNTTAQLQNDMENNMSRKVRRFFSRSNPLVIAFKTSREVDKIRKKLDALARDRTNFGLDIGHQSVWKTREETCSRVRQERIIGRDGVKEELVDMLLTNEGVSFVSIVGIGGLGKTAVAQLVFDHDRIRSEFPLRMWVCVSLDFGVREILSKMLKYVADDNCDGLTLDQLQRRVLQHMQTQKYLLVLDDVWDERLEAWEKLEDFLVGGREGSKVLVTSRSKKVASAIGNCLMHELKGLSEDDSWELFKLMAFDGEEHDVDASLVEIGKDIVKKCSNVPLSIRVIGSLLRGSRDKDRWLLFQRNDLAKIQEAKDKTMAILKFSYCHLTPPLKSCFSFCALFPKDYRIEKDMLIDLWMANGSLVPQCEGQRIEDVGEEYFSVLLQRCFFQDVEEDRFGAILSCKVHDLMHDLALEVAGHESVVMSSTTSSLDRRIRHLSVLPECSVLSSPHNFPANLELMRTFLQLQYMSKLNAKRILTNCRRLRWLDLRCPLQTLPSGIGALIHLRYLHLWGLEKLPKSITNLRNLQVLKLTCCWELRALPKHFSRLVNLRHLDIDSVDAMTHMPTGLKNLTCLQRLSTFALGGDSQEGQMSQLEDLKALANLRDKLTIRVVKFSTSETSAVREGAYLLNKPHLKRLRVIFAGDGRSGGDAEEALLEALRPNCNLVSMRVDGYRGVKLASWMLQDYTMSPSNLVELSLANLPRVEHLPLMSQLGRLKRLTLRKIPNLEYMEGESSDAARAEYSTFYPSLERLDLWALPRIKGWWRDGVTVHVHQPGSEACSDGNGIGCSTSETGELDDDCDGVSGISSLILFPSLRQLYIYSCPNMKAFPPCPKLNDLSLLRMNEVPLFTERRGGGGGGGDLVTTAGPGSSSTISIPPVFALKKLLINEARHMHALPKESIRGLTSVEIRNWEESLLSFGDAMRICASSLQQLMINRSDIKLQSLRGGGIEHLTSLQRLNISCADELEMEEEEEEPWKSLHNLSCLTFSCLPKLVNLPKGIQYLTTLHSLGIHCCDNLRGLPQWLSSLTSLRSLAICGCKSLTLLEARRVLPPHAKLIFHQYSSESD